MRLLSLRVLRAAMLAVAVSAGTALAVGGGPCEMISCWVSTRGGRRARMGLRLIIMASLGAGW